eukprot:scaffold236663_cov55-Attheya_sp.AAC.1
MQQPAKPTTTIKHLQGCQSQNTASHLQGCKHQFRQATSHLQGCPPRPQSPLPKTHSQTHQHI